MTRWFTNKEESSWKNRRRSERTWNFLVACGLVHPECGGGGERMVGCRPEKKEVTRNKAGEVVEASLRRHTALE